MVNSKLLAALKVWQTFARNNRWTDADYHNADGTGWISQTDAAIAAAEAARPAVQGTVIVRLAIGAEACDDGLGEICVIDRGDGFEVFVTSGQLPDGQERVDFGSGPDCLANAFSYALEVARILMVDTASPDGERF